MSRGQAAPAFLVGAARSGTSLVYKALCLHPDAAYFNNWMRRLPSHPAASVGNRLARASQRRRRVWFGDDSNAYVYGRRRSPAARLFPMPVEGEPVYRACGIPEHEPSTAADPAQARCLRRAIRGTLRWGGGNVFINKRVANNLRIGLLADAFPEARFVDITRDGRAVALSLSLVDWWDSSVVWWYGASPAAWRQSGRDPWELCARTWVEDVRVLDNSLQRLTPARVLRISYEDFVAAPLDQLERLADFTGLGPSPAWAAELRELSFPDRNERWRRELAPDVVERITAVQAEELSRRGYAC